MDQSNSKIFQSHKGLCYTKGVHRKSGTARAARSLMSLKKSSNSIGPCDRLLQEPITFPRMISQTFHETCHSNTANATSKMRFKRASTTIKLLCRPFWFKEFFFSHKPYENFHIHEPRRISYIMYLSINIKIMTPPSIAIFCICTSHFKPTTLRDWEK